MTRKLEKKFPRARRIYKLLRQKNFELTSIFLDSIILSKDKMAYNLGASREVVKMKNFDVRTSKILPPLKS